MTRETKDIKKELGEIADRLLEIYNELDEMGDPKTAGHVLGANCQIRNATRGLWREAE